MERDRKGHLKMILLGRGAWVAQSVKRPTLGFGSGHDLTVREFEPCIGLCADSSACGACFGFCVSLSVSAPPPINVLFLRNECLKK